jgi:hypothetical protein
MRPFAIDDLRDAQAVVVDEDEFLTVLSKAVAQGARPSVIHQVGGAR